MPKLVEIEVVVIVNEAGDVAVGLDLDDAKERFDENFTDDGGPRRVVAIALKVPAPEVIELSAEIPAEASTAELKVA